MAKNTQLTGGRELSFIRQKDALLGSLLQKIINGVNSTAQNSAVASKGKLPPPAPIANVTAQGTMDTNSNTLTVAGEQLHWTMTHNSELKKGVQYISEVDTDATFPSPHQIDHGCSRSGFLSLPALDSDGNVQSYYLRSYPQYHGSDPQTPTPFGSPNGPIRIVMTGTSKGTLLPSQGSGTAKNGQQGGRGLGTVLNRPAPGPKRNLK